MAPNKMIATLKEKAAAVQVVVTEIQDLHEAFNYAIDLTKKQGGGAMAAPGWDDAGLAVLRAGCAQAGLALLAENLREHLAEIHTGLTWADWGIAETGTLVLDSSSEDLRLASMLCETHVAVLPTSKILPTAGDLEEEMKRLMQSPPNYLAFITGASRTADIERVLTLGVHGPLELHLLLLKD